MQQAATARFAVALLDWWPTNKRIFPWRETRNPYNVLIAEVLLHRTKAKQVVSVYSEFIKAYPTIEKLSQSSLIEIETKTRKLGLYWRTKLIHVMAKEIVTRFKGVIPEKKNELMNLPGVSQYIASATMCFAFNKPEPIIDTNTVRILGRVFNLQVTDSSRKSSHFAIAYEELSSKESPREFAFAMIDLAALICLPRTPKCAICPVNSFCLFKTLQNGEKY